MIGDLTTLFWLLVGHSLADYPLQGDFLAKAKNHLDLTIGWQLWPWALPAHGLIHGGMVALVTGSVPLGITETLAHCAIDRAKCAGKITFGQDQALHIACKVVWVAVLAVTA